MSSNAATVHPTDFWLLNITKLIVAVYIILRTALLFVYPWEMTFAFRFLAVIFYFAEMFILVHSLGYFSYLSTVGRAKPLSERFPAYELQLDSYPPVAIVVASYKEPLQVVEDTLVCFHNLTYPNKHLFFLDDTRYDKGWDSPEEAEAYKRSIEELCRSMQISLFRRKWHHAKAGMLNDFLDYLSGARNPDYVMKQYGHKVFPDNIPYLIVFDADMNPLPRFVEPLVAIMERHPKAAFVQTPQYYTNFDYNRVARAASLMQAIFYEYICEGKGIKGAMFFCGTNAILRIKALQEVGGIDTTSVTEDIATAFKMHDKGWVSYYYNIVTSFGMAPEDLGALFKQQFRWALGTVGMIPTLFKALIRQPLSHPFSLWWEYFLSSSYYLIGWAYTILLMGPAVYLYWDVPIYMFPPVVYMALLIPYNLLANYLFFTTLTRRGYRFTTLFSGVILNILSIPVFMRASLQGLLGIRGQFTVTPKEGAQSLPLRDLWPQIAYGLLCWSALVWGILRLIFEGGPIYSITVNLFWTIYYLLIFSSIFYFNSPLEQGAKEYVEEPAKA